MNGSVITDARTEGWLPAGFVGELLPFLLETWDGFEIPAGVLKEPRITALFKKRLRKRIKDDLQNDWFVMLETTDHDDLGKEVSRTDIRVLPPGKKDEDYAFVIECKRLSVTFPGGRFAPNADKYADEGMMRFLNGVYGRGLREGGMMGYVMDRDVSAAREAVEQAILARRTRLRLGPGSGYALCRLLDGKPPHGETHHDLLDGRSFTLYHLLVAARCRAG